MNDPKKQYRLPIIDDNLYTPSAYVKIKHPEWSRNATIYQINMRQFSQEGSFHAAEQHLPRLKELGIDIIWLMPVHEIGIKNRKGTLGSPYAVKDHYSVNPELGTMEDLKHFVDSAHALKMYVILDWVANHTAWDNHLVEEHPEWYERDWKGDFRSSPWTDWSDTIDLDFQNPEVRKYMMDAMICWVLEADIDGFRCDVAGFIPLDFWNNVRKQLDAIKPVFMLAEWESRDLHAEAFDMTYAWSWYDIIHQITMGKADVQGLMHYYTRNENAFPSNAMRMKFVSNHDKNAWEGTMWEQFGGGLEAAIVLSVIDEGMPLIYNGQEAGSDKRLAFFERDPIDWKEHPIGTLYKKLFALKKMNTALWNANWGASLIKVPNNVEHKVLSFIRQNDIDKIFAVINFTNVKQVVTFRESLFHGDYTDYFNNEQVEFTKTSSLELDPWSYRIFVR